MNKDKKKLLQKVLKTKNGFKCKKKIQIKLILIIFLRELLKELKIMLKEIILKTVFFLIKVIFNILNF